MPSKDGPKDKKVKKHNELSAAASVLGKAGGVVGGKKRAESLSAAERSKIAADGGRARAAKLKAVLKGKKKKKGDK
jgi:hypothetical protein